MNLVDSSGWLEYFTDGANADIFSKPLQHRAELIVPTICLNEVFKVVLRERNEDDALNAIALMYQGKIVELTSEIAIQSARLSIDYKLPMADSIVLTTAKIHNAILWTQDINFRNIEGVRYYSK